MIAERFPDSVVKLHIQYRMNSGIMELANSTIYQNQMICGSPQVSKSCLELNLEKCVSCGDQCWITKVVDPKLHVVYVETDKVPTLEQSVGTSFQNEIEAQIGLIVI